VTTKGKNLDACFTPDDSPLARQICYGVLRNYYSLKATQSLLLAKPLAKKHTDLHVLLLTGLYSVDHLNRPQHVSVNAVVETAVSFRKTWAKGLINGVLRNYLRNRQTLMLQLDDDTQAASNHPQWLFNRIQLAYPNSTDSIIAANNSHPPMTLRVNLSEIDRPAYQKKLQAQDIGSKPGELAPGALYLTKPVSVDQLPGFAEGLVSVQDEASQLAAPLVNLQPGMTVLDACAAPGGKTCHLLESISDVSLVAVDKDERRLEQVQENLNRLNKHCDLVACDLMEFQPTQSFDRILLDAPCSATGIIRRHPDIKLLRRDTDIVKLAATQLELLAKAWSLLKENGELVYSTCSILPTENELVLSAFRKVCSSADTLPIDATWGEETGVGRQLLPTVDSTDGFFYARLRKTRLMKTRLKKAPLKKQTS